MYCMLKPGTYWRTERFSEWKSKWNMKFAIRQKDKAIPSAMKKNKCQLSPSYID